MGATLSGEYQAASGSSGTMWIMLKSVLFSNKNCIILARPSNTPFNQLISISCSRITYCF